MFRRPCAVIADFFRPPSPADAGVFLLALTAVAIPWGHAAVVPARLIREITARLTPGLLSLAESLPAGLPVTAVTGTGCVVCGALLAMVAVRRGAWRVFYGVISPIAPFILLFTVAGIRRSGDPALNQMEAVEFAASLAVAVAGYLSLAVQENMRGWLISLYRILALSCAMAAMVRQFIPDIGPLFNAGGVDPLAMPLCGVLAVGGARYIARIGSPFDTFLLLILAMSAGWGYPAGGLTITGMLAVITAVRAFRDNTRQSVYALGRALMLLVVMLAVIASRPDHALESARDMAAACRDLLPGLMNAGLTGMGSEATVHLSRGGDPWQFPPPMPPGPLAITLEFGATGLVAYGWLWLVLFRRAGLGLDAWSGKSERSDTRKTLADILITLFPAVLVLPAPPTLFVISVLVIAAAIPAAIEPPAKFAARTATGPVFRMAGWLMVSGLPILLGLNLFRFGWILGETRAVAQSVQTAWAAEKQGQFEQARSGWSDAAWRLALLSLLDESNAPTDSPAVAAARLNGLDRLLAETPGWFSHPDIRDKRPGEWPVVVAVRDAAHFGQARVARALGRPGEAMHWLETIAKRTANSWPEVLVMGGLMLREYGNLETGDALMRLAKELAETLPPQPDWVPPQALSFEGFVAFLTPDPKL